MINKSQELNVLEQEESHSPDPGVEPRSLRTAEEGRSCSWTSLGCCGVGERHQCTNLCQSGSSFLFLAEAQSWCSRPPVSAGASPVPWEQSLQKPGKVTRFLCWRERTTLNFTLDSSSAVPKELFFFCFGFVVSLGLRSRAA